MSPQMLINGFMKVADKITRSLNIILWTKNMMLVFCLTIYSDLSEDLLLLCTENVHFSYDKWIILYSKGSC